MAEGAVHVGTSGWHYEHWVGPFYPQEMKAEEMLSFYAGQLATVEINNSFYQLPSSLTLQEWRKAVPGGFVFAVKASRYLTHMKKLKDPEEPLATFLSRVEELGDKLGPVLFQLPPRWRCNPERLTDFLDRLPGNHRYAFEFRDPSWFDDRVYRALGEAGAAFCIYELAGRLSPKEVTADLVYLRLHGPSPVAYQGCYDQQSLAAWAEAIKDWRRQGRDVYCYFDNDQQGYAARNAQALKKMLE